MPNCPPNALGFGLPSPDAAREGTQLKLPHCTATDDTDNEDDVSVHSLTSIGSLNEDEKKGFPVRSKMRRRASSEPTDKPAQQPTSYFLPPAHPYTKVYRKRRLPPREYPAAPPGFLYPVQKQRSPWQSKKLERWGLQRTSTCHRYDFTLGIPSRRYEELWQIYPDDDKADGYKSLMECYKERKAELRNAEFGWLLVSLDFDAKRPHLASTRSSVPPHARAPYTPEKCHKSTIKDLMQERGILEGPRRRWKAPSPPVSPPVSQLVKTTDWLTENALSTEVNQSMEVLDSELACSQLWPTMGL